MARPPLGAARMSRAEYQRRWRAKAKARRQKPPARPQSRGLNTRQTAFVQQYLLDCNAVAAAARAGYRRGDDCKFRSRPAVSMTRSLMIVFCFGSGRMHCPAL